MISTTYAASFVIVAIVILLVLATVAMFAYVIYWNIRNSASPITRVEAKVVRKRSKEWDMSIAAGTPETLLGWFSMMGRDRLGAAKSFLRRSATSTEPELQIAQSVQYLMSFSFNSHEEELEVPEPTFARAYEGDIGLLSFKGEKFICFIPNIKR